MFDFLGFSPCAIKLACQKTVYPVCERQWSKKNQSPKMSDHQKTKVVRSVNNVLITVRTLECSGDELSKSSQSCRIVKIM